jgi:hypothetical protein
VLIGFIEAIRRSNGSDSRRSRRGEEWKKNQFILFFFFRSSRLRELREFEPLKRRQTCSEKTNPISVGKPI